MWNWVEKQANAPAENADFNFLNTKVVTNYTQLLDIHTKIGALKEDADILKSDKDALKQDLKNAVTEKLQNGGIDVSAWDGQIGNILTAIGADQETINTIGKQYNDYQNEKEKFTTQYGKEAEMSRKDLGKTFRGKLTMKDGKISLDTNDSSWFRSKNINIPLNFSLTADRIRDKVQIKNELVIANKNGQWAEVQKAQEKNTAERQKVQFITTAKTKALQEVINDRIAKGEIKPNIKDGKLETDGILGGKNSETRKAIKALQQKLGFTGEEVDGIVGTNTFGRLTKEEREKIMNADQSTTTT